MKKKGDARSLIIRFKHIKQTIKTKRERVYSQSATSLNLGQSEAEIFITRRVSPAVCLATRLTAAATTTETKVKQKINLGFVFWAEKSSGCINFIFKQHN